MNIKTKYKLQCKRCNHAWESGKPDIKACPKCKSYIWGKERKATYIKTEDLTQKILKELLDYNPDTGVFTWKVNRGGGVSAGDIAGSLNPQGYITIGVYNITYLAHRLAWLWMEGYFPIKIDIDHEDRIKHHNMWSNLRLVSRTCNLRNCNLSKWNKSGVTGICWNRALNKWHSQIRANNKGMHLGYFLEKDDAVKARWEAEKKYEFKDCNTTSSAYLYLKDRNLI